MVFNDEKNALVQKSEPPGKTPVNPLLRIIVIFLIFLVAVLSAGVIFHKFLLRAYAPQILDTLAAQMEEFYDLKFEWRGTRIGALNDFSIKGVSLTDIPSGQKFAEIETLRIRTSLFALAIRGQDEYRGATSVELINPVITLSRVDEKWNTGSLFEPSTGEKYIFPGRLSVVISSGKFIWTGGEFSPGVFVRPFRIDNLKGLYKYKNGEKTGMNLNGVISGDNITESKMDVNADFNPETFLFRIVADADTLDSKLLSEWLSNYHLSEISGPAKIRVSMLFGPDVGENGYSIIGTASLSDSTLAIEGYNLRAESLQGEVQFSHKSLFASELTGLIDGAEMTVRGRIGDFGNVNYNLVGDFDGLPFHSISKIVKSFEGFPAYGTVSGRVELTGKPDNLKILIASTENTLTILKQDANIKHFEGWWDSGIFTCSKISARILGGDLKGTFEIDSTGNQSIWKFLADGSGFPVRNVVSTAGLVQTGKVIPSGDLSFSLQGQGTGFENPQISGIINSNNLLIPQIAFTGPLNVSAPLEISKNAINVKSASAGNATLSSISDAAYSFKTRDLSGKITLSSENKSFIESLTNQAVSGNVIFSGDFSVAKSDSINFEGEVLLTDGRLGPIPTGKFEAGIKLNDEHIKLTDVSGVLGDGTLTGSMTIPISGTNGNGSAGNFSLKGFDGGSLLDTTYSGLLSTSMDIDGTFKYSTAQSGLGTVDALFEANENNAMIGPNLISFSDNPFVIRLSMPLSNLSNTSIFLDGHLKSEPVLSPVFEGRVLTKYSSKIIEKLTEILTGSHYLPNPKNGEFLVPQITGNIRLSASLKGLTDGLRGQVEIASDGATVSGWHIDSGKFRIDSSDGEVWSIDLSLSEKDAGAFRLTGQILRNENLLQSPLFLHASLQNGGLNQAFKFIGIGKWAQFSGNITGEGDITGTLASPVVMDFGLEFKDSEVMGLSLNQGTINFGFEYPFIRLDSLDISGSGGFRAMGAGVVDLTAPNLSSATLVARLDNLDLGAISDAIDEIENADGGSRKNSVIPIRGLLSLAVQLASDAAGAKVLYNGRIDDFSFLMGGKTFPIGDLSANAVSRPGGTTLTINSLDLKQNGDLISVSGTMPFPSVRLMKLFADLSRKNRDKPTESEIYELKRFLMEIPFNIDFKSETGYAPVLPEGLIANGLSFSGGLGQIDLHLGGIAISPLLSGTLGIDVKDIKIGELLLATKLSGNLIADKKSLIANPNEIALHGGNWKLGITGHADVIDIFYPKLDLLSVMSRGLPQLIGIVTNGSNGEKKGIFPDGSIALSVDLTEFNPLIFSGNGYSISIKKRTDEPPPGIVVDKGYLKLTGSMDLINGNINLAALPPLPVFEGDSAKEPGIFFNFAAHLAGTLNVRNGDLYNFQFASGNIALTGSDLNPAFVGKIVAPEGWLDILGNHFVLTKDLEMFFSSVFPFDPRVKTQAEVTVRDVRSPGYYGEELLVRATIDNRMSQILDGMVLVSEPPLSYENILLALAYEDFFIRTAGDYLMGEGNSGLDSFDVNNVLLPIASSYITKYMRQQAGISDFQLSFDRNDNLRIYIEDEVMDNLVMYFSQTFGVNIDNYEWGVRYRFRPRSWVGFSFDSDEDLILKMQYIIPFDWSP